MNPASSSGSSTASSTSDATSTGPAPACSTWDEWTCEPTQFGNACEATCGDYIIDCNNEWGLCNWGYFNGANIGSCNYDENAFDKCEGCEHGITMCQPF